MNHFKDKKDKILITGAAGFVGFSVSEFLLQKGFSVVGFDGMDDYYSVELKKQRIQILKNHHKFKFYQDRLEKQNRLIQIGKDEKPTIVIHLAAQAGVRYSIENPKSYFDSNLLGTFNIIEMCRLFKVKHFLMASTSSVYGANNNMPFDENQNCDTPLSFYAATKKSCETITHSYSHVYNIPTTLFRFFTVYGPWGRPDMALYKFAESIVNKKPIDIYNNGDMKRDFTYISDIVEAIFLLMEKPPEQTKFRKQIFQDDSISPVAPWRVVNIGNGVPVGLMKYIHFLEKALNRKAIKNFLPMQIGDVRATWADTSLLEQITGFKARVDVEEGVAKFVDWYLEYTRSRLD